MDAKFRQILTLALRPETGDGESAAALTAARRMVSKNGLDAMMGGPSSNQGPQRVVTQVVEKPVYRDRTVFVTWPNPSTTLSLTIKTSDKWMCSLVERLFQDSRTVGVDVEIIRCHRPKNPTGIEIEIKAHGAGDDIDLFKAHIDHMIDQANRKNPGSSSQSLPKLNKTNGIRRHMRAHPWSWKIGLFLCVLAILKVIGL